MHVLTAGLHVRCLSKSITTRCHVDGTCCASWLLLHSSFTNRPAPSGSPSSPTVTRKVTHTCKSDRITHTHTHSWMSLLPQRLNDATHCNKQKGPSTNISHWIQVMRALVPPPSECSSDSASYAESRSELRPPPHVYGSSLRGHHLSLTFLHLLLSMMTFDPFREQKE